MLIIKIKKLLVWTKSISKSAKLTWLTPKRYPFWSNTQPARPQFWLLEYLYIKGVFGGAHSKQLMPLWGMLNSYFYPEEILLSLLDINTNNTFTLKNQFYCSVHIFIYKSGYFGLRDQNQT